MVTRQWLELWNSELKAVWKGRETAMAAMPVYLGQKTMFSLPSPFLLYCSWPEPHLMATLGYTEAREAENLFELDSANQELLCGVESDCRRRFISGGQCPH